MRFGREMHTFTETSIFKYILTLEKWSHNNVAFVMMKYKHKLYFSDYLKNITHVQINKMLKVSFKPFNAHRSTLEKTD